MFRFFLVAALPRWDLRALRGDMVFVHLLNGIVAKFASALREIFLKFFLTEPPPSYKCAEANLRSSSQFPALWISAHL